MRIFRDLKNLLGNSPKLLILFFVLIPVSSWVASKYPLLVLGALLLSLFLLLIYVAVRDFYFRKYAFGAPFVPTEKKVLKLIEDVFEKYEAGNVVDLGSGNGRVCFKLARRGIKCTGYEINPILVYLSKIRKFLHPSKKYLNFRRANFWETSLADFDGVMIYGIGYIMNDLAEKLKEDLREGSVVVTFRFPLPGKTPVEERDRLYVYKF